MSFVPPNGFRTYAWCSCDVCRSATINSVTPPKRGLPTDDKERKALPIWDGTFGYFPDALIEVARVSRIGNDQHNPGEKLHWARGKSMDQVNTAARHLLDHTSGTLKDTDGSYHLAKACWRLLAELQLTLEQKGT